MLQLQNLQQKGLIKKLWMKKSNPVQRPSTVEAITNRAIISTKSLFTNRACPNCGGLLVVSNKREASCLTCSETFLLEKLTPEAAV